MIGAMTVPVSKLSHKASTANIRAVKNCTKPGKSQAFKMVLETLRFMGFLINTGRSQEPGQIVYTDLLFAMKPRTYSGSPNEKTTSKNVPSNHTKKSGPNGTFAIPVFTFIYPT